MRRSLPSRVLLPLAGAGVAVAGAIVLTLVSASAVLPLAVLGLAAAAMALTLAAITRQVLEPLEELAAVLDPADPPASSQQQPTSEHGGGTETAPPVPDLGQLAEREDAVGRVAAAAMAYSQRSAALEAQQAAVTRSLATTMSDVARRELALVNRLLDQLDTLERDETDPARLEQLYVLDHLAVRLRGQSEDLLVVADAAPDGDPDEPPMAAVDLVRVAASRAEDYRRVTADADLPGSVVGWAARPLAQLLAALLDNALRYSPPTQHVTVTGRMVPGALLLTVRDRGIGMDEASLEQAAATIAAPPLLDAARSRRLGLYVVGVLARRLGVTVRLEQAQDAAGGVEATVHVPSGLLEGGQMQSPSARAAEVWGLTDVADQADTAEHASSEPGPSDDVRTPGPATTEPIEPPAEPAAVEPAAAQSQPSGPAQAQPVASTSPGGAPVVDLAAELGWSNAPSLRSKVTGTAPVAPAADPTATPPADLPAAAPAAEAPAAARPPAAAEEPTHAEERHVEVPARRRKRRAAAASSWSINPLEPAGQDAEPAAPGDVGFVNDVSTWQAAQTSAPAAPAAWLVDGPSMPSRPVAIPTGDRAPHLDVPPHVEQADDYIPPIVDNPLLDILPEHPTAQLAPIMPSAVDMPSSVRQPTVLDGIRLAGGTPAARPAPQPSLPTRAPRAGEEQQARTELFGRGTDATSDLDLGDEDAQFDALAGLVAIDEEGSW